MHYLLRLIWFSIRSSNSYNHIRFVLHFFLSQLFVDMNLRVQWSSEYWSSSNKPVVGHRKGSGIAGNLMCVGVGALVIGVCYTHNARLSQSLTPFNALFRGSMLLSVINW